MQNRRLVINVRGEDVEQLETRARRNIRPLRDEAAWLVHWALAELAERKRRASPEATPPTEAVA